MKKSASLAFSSFVNGLDVNGHAVSEVEHRERGVVLGGLQEEWVKLWDP